MEREKLKELKKSTVPQKYAENKGQEKDELNRKYKDEKRTLIKMWTRRKVVLRKEWRSQYNKVMYKMKIK